ncbi:LOW QUALITY PROTEIN: uncharacterized protein C22orf24 homolog [Pteropus alecto]|uniref:LOW QUALITY PROTEIN: uncharacterized protein C22orf24 homolog n=1 Tax=Pteropus alecto TaxID=9402 RepID=UPI00076882B6|nr:LOW QUALITY PROTEIN: uncharacterized protein C22orf24 homolog [Pteropus alecto]
MAIINKSKNNSVGFLSVTWEAAQVDGRVRSFFSSEGVRYFTLDRSAKSRGTPPPQAGRAQCWIFPLCIETVSSSPPPDRESRDAGTLSRSQLYLQSLALCLAYSRSSINTSQVTECIVSASGSHRALREPGRWEESFRTLALPYISRSSSKS